MTRKRCPKTKYGRKIIIGRLLTVQGHKTNFDTCAALVPTEFTGQHLCPLNSQAQQRIVKGNKK